MVAVAATKVVAVEARAVVQPETLEGMVELARTPLVVLVVPILVVAVALERTKTVLVETVFDWPGVGLYATQAIMSQDFMPVIGVALDEVIAGGA